MIRTLIRLKKLKINTLEGLDISLAWSMSDSDVFFFSLFFFFVKEQCASYLPTPKSELGLTQVLLKEYSSVSPEATEDCNGGK